MSSQTNINSSTRSMNGLNTFSTGGGVDIEGDTIYCSYLDATGGVSTVNLSVTGVLLLPSNSIADGYLSNNVAFLNGSQTFTGTNTFNGNTNLTNINVSGSVSLPNNSISDSALSTNVALLGSNQTFTGISRALTASVGTNTTQLATCEFVLANAGATTLLSSNNTYTGLNTFSALVTANNGITMNNGTTQPFILQSGGNGCIRMLNNTTNNLIQSGTSAAASSLPLLITSVGSATPWATIAPSGTSINGFLFATNQVASAGSGSGSIDIQLSSQNNKTGYLELKTDNGTRLGYIGYAPYNNSTQLGTGYIEHTGENGTTGFSFNKDIVALGNSSVVINNNGTSSFSSGTLGSGANLRMFGVAGVAAYIDYYSVLNFRPVNSVGNETLGVLTTFGTDGSITTPKLRAQTELDVGLSNPIQYFSGTYTNSGTTNPLSGVVVSTNTYLLITSSNTITYSGTIPLELNYVIVGGGGSGGKGTSNTSTGGGSGGGGSGGEFIFGTRTLTTGQSIASVIGGANSLSSLTIGGTLIATALGGNAGANVTGGGTQGGNGGNGAGGSPLGGAGGTAGSPTGAPGTANATTASGGGGNNSPNTGTTNIGGVFTNSMADGTTTNKICIGGRGGIYNTIGTVNPNSFGSGGNGGGGQLGVGLGFVGGTGVQGCILLFFPTDLFSVTSTQVLQQFPTTFTYNKLPTFTAHQLGYVVSNKLTGTFTTAATWLQPTGNTGQITLSSVGVYLLTYAFSVKSTITVIYGCLSLSSTAPYTAPQSTAPTANVLAFQSNTANSANNVSVSQSYIYKNETTNTIMYFWWGCNNVIAPNAEGCYYQAVRIA